MITIPRFTLRFTRGDYIIIQYFVSIAALGHFTATTIVVLLCPLSLMWLKLAALFEEPSKATSKQPSSLDHGSSKTLRQKSQTAVCVFCPSKKRCIPDSEAIMTTVCILIILGVLFLLLLLAGDVERNPGPVDLTTRVSEEKVDQLAALLDDVSANWFLFLGQLGVSYSVREQIQLEAAGLPNLARHCLTKGIFKWVISNEQPTYRDIVNVLNGHFLSNKLLVSKVEEFVQALNSTHGSKLQRKGIFSAGSAECRDYLEEYREYLQEYYKS